MAESPYPTTGDSSLPQRVGMLEIGQAVMSTKIQELLDADNRLLVALTELKVRVDRMTWALTASAISLTTTTVVLLITLSGKA